MGHVPGGYMGGIHAVYSVVAEEGNANDIGYACRAMRPAKDRRLPTAEDESAVLLPVTVRGHEPGQCRRDHTRYRR